MTSTPFTDPASIAALYATADRTQQRTGALLTAKIRGDDSTASIVELAARNARQQPVVCEIGCGRGTVTLALADALTPASLTVIDISDAFLDTVARRAAKVGVTVTATKGDFHHLPIPDATTDVLVAAFCLYHSPTPAIVVSEIARCLTPTGHAVLATKSTDSYHEIDQLMASTGLDPHAADQPSLYQTFHSHNAPDVVVAGGLQLEDVIHRDHVFRFEDFYHLAAYAVTIPKYQLPQTLTGDPRNLAAELRRRTTERAFTTTSTVTYLIGKRP